MAQSSQLELFSQAAQNSGTQQGLSQAVALRLKALEKTILLIIALLVTGVIAFCAGVEKGKRAAAVAAVTRMDMAAKTAPVEPTATNAPLRASATVKTVVTVAPAAVPVTVPVSNNRYVIQVASYLGKKNAQMVADALKKKGYPAAVASKGTYHIVLVGAFTDKPSAMAMLAKLQKKYDGCFIRRQ